MAAELWLSPVGVTAPDADKERSFLEWCGQKGEQVHLLRCSIAHVPTSGRSVIATEDIREGDVVVDVKDDAVLLAERSCIAADLERARLTKSAQRGGGDEEDDHHHPSSPDALLEVQALILALMAERLRGKRSPWAAYIDFFPASAKELGGMPLFWSQRQRRRLRGTAAADKTRGRLQHPADAPTRVGELWRDVALPFILEGCPKLRRMLGLGDGDDEEEEEDDGGAPAAPPSSSMASRLRAARRLYRWATAVVASYSFVLGDDRYQALVPAWDALNHVSGRRNVRLAHEHEDDEDEDGGGGGGVRGGRLRMVATRPIAKGEEVVNRYGPLSTSELLRGYGFVERGNPHAHAQVPAQFALRAAAAAAGGEGGSGGGKQRRPVSGGKRGRRQDEEGAAEEPLPPEAWAELGEEFAIGDSDAEVDLDLEEEGEEDEEEDDASCSDADSGTGEGGADDPPASEDDEEDDDKKTDPSSSPPPLPSLEQAQRRAPCWPLVFCAARALRLLPRGGAFRVPGVPEAEDDEEAGGGENEAEAAASIAPATKEEQRWLLGRLIPRSGSDSTADDEGGNDDLAESYAAARRAARQRFPDALAAFMLLCLHAAQPLPPPPAPKKRGGGGRKKKKADEEDNDDDDRPKPPPGVDAVVSHLRALARTGGQDSGRTNSALHTARALWSNGVTPQALRAACLATLAAMRRRYAGGGLERDRARAARLSELAPRRAAALLARLEEQEALEDARVELEEQQGAEGASELMARACAALWAALVRRREAAREAAAEAEAEEDEDEDDEEEEEEEHGDCGKGCHHHHHHHPANDDGKSGKKKKTGEEKGAFAFNFAV
jgi:SET domain-containing protein 6